MVDVQPRSVGDRLQLLQRHVEPVARPEGARGDERVAAAQLAPLDARERERDALPRLGALDGPSCTWTLRTRTSRPAGSTRSASPSPIVPDQSVPVTTVPIPRSEKTRST